VGTGGGMTSQRAGMRPSRRARLVWWGALAGASVSSRHGP